MFMFDIKKNLFYLNDINGSNPIVLLGSCNDVNIIKFILNLDYITSETLLLCDNNNKIGLLLELTLNKNYESLLYILESDKCSLNMIKLLNSDDRNFLFYLNESDSEKNI